MKQLLLDIAYSIYEDMSDFILMSIQFAIIFVILGNVVLYNIAEIDDPYIKHNKNGYQYYKLYQNSFNSSFINLWDDPFSIEKMKSTLRKLRSTNEFEYTSMGINRSIKMFTNDLEQHFGKQNYDNYLAYSAYPEYYQNNGNKPIPEEYWNDESAIDMALCKVDKNAVKHYDLTVCEGRNFEDKDFVLNLDTNETVVVLGSEYRSYYEVGESIRIATPIKIMQATVIGFLEPQTFVENDTTFEHLGEAKMVLDYSVILPCFEVIGNILTEEDKKFVSLEYTDNLCGTVIFSENAQRKEIENIMKGINDFYLDNGVFTVVTMTATNGLLYFQGESKSAVNCLKILIIVLIVYCVVSLYFSLMNKVRKNLYTIAIQLINGKTFSQIVFGFSIEIIIIILLGATTAYIHSRTWIEQPMLFQITFFCIVLVQIVMSIIAIKKGLINIDLYKVLWRDEK